MATNQSTQQLTLFDIQPSGRGSVYALLMPSHAIKLGFTGRPVRVRAAELGGQLLASCPGTRDDERWIHERLEAWRIGRTEDFWPAAEVWCAVDLINLTHHAA